MLNPNRRHDKLLRLYLAATRERAEAQLAGSSASRVQRLAVRERALAGAVRSIRLRLGLPDTFDPELESARLGIDGKRPRPHAPTTACDERSQHGSRPRVRPVPVASGTPQNSSQESPHLDVAPRAIRVTDLLDFFAAHGLDPDSEVVVRPLTGGHRPIERGEVDVVAIRLTDDGRVQLDIRSVRPQASLSRTTDQAAGNLGEGGSA